MDDKLKQAYARMYSTWTPEDHARAADLSKDPEYIKYHREQAKAKSTQKESRMNTPLINATLRYLDEQMLDEAKKSPWTVKKHEGDDEYSYALFKNGKPAMTGLGKREAKYHLERAKAGHYDRKLDEEAERLDESPILGALAGMAIGSAIVHGAARGYGKTGRGVVDRLLDAHRTRRTAKKVLADPKAKPHQKKEAEKALASNAGSYKKSVFQAEEVEQIDESDQLNTPSAAHFMHHGKKYLQHAQEAMKREDRGDYKSADAYWDRATSHLNHIYDHYGKKAADEVQSNCSGDADLVSIGKTVRHKFER